MNQLPSELIRIIMKYLDSRSLLSARLVCCKYSAECDYDMMTSILNLDKIYGFFEWAGICFENEKFKDIENVYKCFLSVGYLLREKYDILRDIYLLAYRNEHYNLLKILINGPYSLYYCCTYMYYVHSLEFMGNSQDLSAFLISEYKKRGIDYKLSLLSICTNSNGDLYPNILDRICSPPINVNLMNYPEKLYKILYRHPDITKTLLEPPFNISMDFISSLLQLG